MPILKRILAACLTLALGSALLAGCSQSPAGSSAGGSASGSQDPGSSSAASGEEGMDLSVISDPYLATAGLAGDTVVAYVGEYPISAGEVLYWLNIQLQSYSSYGMADIPWEEELDGQPLKQILLDGALEAAACYRLLPEMGAAQGLTLSQEDQDYPAQDIAAITQELGSEQATEHLMWAQLLTGPMYEQIYHAGSMYTPLMEHFYGENSGSCPTDAEVQAYLQEEGRYWVKHILLSKVDTATRAPLEEAEIAENKAKAEEMLEQIQTAEDPVDVFNRLMREHSQDPGLATNPDGYVTAKGEMVPEFEEASLALKEGEISGIVESDLGFHIILRLPLDPNDYREELMTQRMDQQVRQWLEEQGTRTTDAFGQIDPVSFWEKARQLQAAAQAEVQAILEEKQAEQQAKDDSSSSVG
ncbi:MAG: hypothetical protein HFF50_02210 [Lawsonibacter sp.]|nr:hypothetical protein [Lawsonibacter sp.]